MFGAQSAHEYSLFLEGLAGDMTANAAAMESEQPEISTAGQSLIDRVKQKATQVTEISKSIYYIGGTAAMLYHGGEKVLPFLLPFFGGK